ncbi:MAG: class I adenylate-forming enzyme family protein [Bacillota bacterium]
MLFESLFTHAREHPQDIAVADDSGQYGYQQLAAMSAGLGMYLASQTTRPHVGLLLPPSAGFVASFYGTLLAGKSVVPLNYLLGEREIAHVIQDSGIDTVVTVPQLAPRLKDAALKVIDLTQLPKTPPAIAPRFPTPGTDDLAVLMYTSGTSGLPKGVMLTYGNLQSDVDACIIHANLQSKYTFIGVVPLFHAFGMTAMMLAPIQLGAPIVYMSRFSPMAALQAVRKHPVAVMFGVPSMYAAILRMGSATPEDFKQMFAAISGGEPLPAAVRDGWERRFGQPLYEGYGLTETSPVISLNTPVARRPGSVGRPVPNVEVRIADDDGKPLPADHNGEVWLRGPMIMKGYYNLPAETANVLTADGFFKTGDLGKVDADGFLYITGRKKDLIIVAGEKVSPREIEEVLCRHASIAEAAVIGKKDPARGEVVAAFVVARPNVAISSDELRAFCREQGLPQYKIPREVLVVPDLPRSATGKVLKRVLIERVNEAQM